MIKRSLIASLSAVGLIGIAMWEGFEPVAKPPVPGDVDTVAFGHTGPDVKLGDKVTVERGLVLLLDDTNEAASAVRQCAPVPMYQHEFDAYTSLAFNIGTRAFCRSTLVYKLNIGDYPGACAEILRWDKFKGKPLKGLARRRQAEYLMCIKNPESAPPLDAGAVARSGSGTGG